MVQLTTLFSSNGLSGNHMGKHKFILVKNKARLKLFKDLSTIVI